MIPLSILIGIGFMLIGAMAYALPQQQELVALVPSFAGMIMAVGGIVCVSNEKSWTSMLYCDAFACGILLLYGVLSVIADTVRIESRNIHLMADIDIIFLSSVFLCASISSLLKIRAGQGKPN